MVVVFRGARLAVLKELDCGPGLPDGAKFGKYCQKSLFSKKFANFYGNIF